MKQRTRALQTAYDGINTAQGKSASTDVRGKKKERVSKDEIRSVRDMIQSVLGLIVNTVDTCRQAFGRLSGSSMIESLLAFSQDSDRYLHEPSIPEELRLTTDSLLSSLPNSAHFFALPSDIKSFKPFIDLGSSSSTISGTTLNQKLRTWFSASLDHLRNTAGGWLLRLATIREVWEVRKSTLGWLSKRGSSLGSAEAEALSFFINEQCGIRVEDIWKLLLHNLLSSFSEHLGKALAEIVGNGPGSELGSLVVPHHYALHNTLLSDISPTTFLLSAPSIPSVSQASLSASLAQSSFQRFSRGIKQRMDGMTPLIDSIASDLESVACKLRSDLDNAFLDQNSQRYIVELASGRLFIRPVQEFRGQVYLLRRRDLAEALQQLRRAVQRRY